MYHHNSPLTSRSSIIRRIVVYSILFFTLGIAQCSFFAGLSFLSVVPDIVMGAVVAIALLDTQKNAIICGIAAGAMIDALGGSGLSLSPIFFLIIAIICSEIAKKILPTFISWAVILIPAVALRSFFTLISLAISFDGIAFSSVFSSILLPEAILTFFLSLPIFFAVKLCVKIADAKNKFKL